MLAASGILWDACDLLNLIATDRASEILPVFGCPSYVVKEVRLGEVFYLRPLPEEDPTGGLVPVEVTPLLNAGLLTEIELDASEQTLFVTYATVVDDGEARTAAVAAHRGFWMMTDDRPMLRLARGLSPPVPVLTTPEWLKHWVDTSGIASDALGEVIRRIEVCAHFVPRRAHLLKAWWDSCRPTT